MISLLITESPAQLYTRIQISRDGDRALPGVIDTSASTFLARQYV